MKRIYDRVSGLIEAHAPDEMAVEAPFFGQNVQSMLKWAGPRVWRGGPWRGRCQWPSTRRAA